MPENAFNTYTPLSRVPLEFNSRIALLTVPASDVVVLSKVISENAGNAAPPGFPVALVIVKKLVVESSIAGMFRNTKFPGPLPAVLTR